MLLYLSLLGFFHWILALSVLLWGTWLTWLHLKRDKNIVEEGEPVRCRPVSILKPVKGWEEGLYENIESFFHLDYPEYEILFSVADMSDPACDKILELMNKYPHVPSQLVIGDVPAGPNPKVNNLVKSYDEALHDWILISDSNVRVGPGYLREVVRGVADDVGIVTAIVAGREPASLGAWLEAVFLNTFYARWMIFAGKIGAPVVVGKSMLFRRSEADRFGGISVLGRYLAEDYMAGKAMTYLGHKIQVMKEPVSQPLGRYPLKSFWARHIRWGRIRKAQAPVAFAFEPSFSSVLSGFVGSVSVSYLTGWPVRPLIISHFAVWYLADAVLMIALGEKPSLRAMLAWALREVLHLPLWLHISLGRKVNWRGRPLKLARGGILEGAQ